MSFPKYPKYKDSGVEWLGEVPEHWKVGPIKRLIKKIESGTSVNALDEPAENGKIGVLKTSCVYTGVFDSNENKTVIDEEINLVSCPLKTWTIIVSRMNTPDLIGAAGLVTYARENIFLPDRLWQISFTNTDPRFVHFWTLTSLYRGQVKAVCTGTSSSMKNLGQDQFGDFSFVVPPTLEQTRIANFLDQETSKIDALVGEQRRLIELLKEKRQAVISHAVTKGLNPNAPLKPTGIEWLGDVPEHWEVMRIKHLTRSIEQGWSPQCEGYPVEDESEWGVLKVGCVNSGRFNPQENKVLPENLAPIPSLAISNGDLLISRANTRELVGRSAVAVANYSNLMLCDKLYRLRLKPDIASPSFLSLYLGSSEARGPIELGATGASASMVNIGQSTILELEIAVPPIDEQIAIERAIQHETQKLDVLTAEAELAIALLQERRTALISAAVTGKIDVRHLANSETA